MLLHTRKADVGLATGITTREIARTSRLVSRLTGYAGAAEQGDRRAATRSRTSPASTRTACSRSARPTRSWTRRPSGSTPTRLVLGKHSGRHALQQALEELGYEVDGAGAEPGVQALQGDRGPQEAGHRDGPRGARHRRAARTTPAPYTLEWFEVEASNRRPPHATVVGPHAGRRDRRGDFTGDGPVDAIFRAINAATRREARLREFRVDAVTGGQDALGEASVVLELGGQSAAGQGVSTDIIEAAALAYVRALSNASAGVTRRRARPTAEPTRAHADAVAEPAPALARPAARPRGAGRRPSGSGPSRRASRRPARRCATRAPRARSTWSSARPAAWPAARSGPAAPGAARRRSAAARAPRAAAGGRGVEVGHAPDAAVDVLAPADLDRREQPRDGAGREHRLGDRRRAAPRARRTRRACRAGAVDRRDPQAPVEARAERATCRSRSSERARAAGARAQQRARRRRRAAVAAAPAATNGAVAAPRRARRSTRPAQATRPVPPGSAPASPAATVRGRHDRPVRGALARGQRRGARTSRPTSRRSTRSAAGRARRLLEPGDAARAATRSPSVPPAPSTSDVRQVRHSVALTERSRAPWRARHRGGRGSGSPCRPSGRRT